MQHPYNSELRKENFLNKAMIRYLESVAKDFKAEKIKEVEVSVKEVPGGKTVKELQEMGIQTSFKKNQKDVGNKNFQNIKKPMLRVKKKEANRIVWYTYDISSPVADSLDYIKYRRAITKKIIKWLEEKGAETLFTGGELNFKESNSISNFQEKLNSIEIIHEPEESTDERSVRYIYDFNGEYVGNSRYEEIPGFIENVEDRLSILFHHLSSKWIPEIENFYIQRCGKIKRYGTGPEVISTFKDGDEKTPVLNITFITGALDAIAGLGDEPLGKAAFVDIGERMHFDLTDYVKEYPSDSYPEGVEYGTSREQTKNIDLIINHEFCHFWSKDGFLSNTDLFLLIPNKVFSEGFAELFSAGHFNSILELVELLEKDEELSDAEKKEFIDTPYNRKNMENGFSKGGDFNYLGGGAAVFFLARKMFKNGYYILDFFNEINKDLGEKDFDDVFKKYSGYEDLNEWEEDFLKNWVEVFFEVAKEKREAGIQEIYSIDSKVIGGPGSVADKSDYVQDEPAIARKDFGKQNQFFKINEKSVPESIKKFQNIYNDENQLVYFCEDGEYSNISNFIEMFELKEGILEIYCIVITDKEPGSRTLEGLFVFDGSTVDAFQALKVENKTLYTIAVNIKNDFLYGRDYFSEILRKIPNTVNEYKKSPENIYATGNLLITSNTNSGL